MVLGGLDDILKATQTQITLFSSIEDVLNADNTTPRKRGTRN
jgi:hypothetical protein